MERRDDSGDRWLLDTLRSVSRVVAEDTDAATLATRLPAELVGVPEQTAAWIGYPTRSPAAIRIRTASDSLPDQVSVEDGLTRQALSADAPQICAAADCPEHQQLVETGAISPASTAIVIPLPTLQNDAVVHLYTDGDCTGTESTEIIDEIAALLATGFEQRETARELTRERERLEQLRSLVSHDFGNPINIAAGRLDLVRTECDSEHIDHVESALTQLEALADQGLLFVKAGRELEAQTELELATIAEECWEFIDAPADALTVEEMQVYAEPERLRMLLNQLFDNAVVHSDDAVTVTVGALADDRGFYVEDDGPGIPDRDLEYVFDRGYTTVTERDGNGLALVEEIAGALGWAVDITESNDGTRIEILTAVW
ncbi:sensor histidine kinase [Halovenus halobia]|uniref:sensor histidine kinase n=1 Tax=Halovenus halobia TaxID=3396622 RepID=UPI003F562620